MTIGVKWETRNSGAGREVALPDSGIRVSRSLASWWILHHKKNEKVFVSINDIFKYISQIGHFFCASLSMASQKTNLKETVAKESGWRYREEGKRSGT